MEFIVEKYFQKIEEVIPSMLLNRNFLTEYRYYCILMQAESISLLKYFPNCFWDSVVHNEYLLRNLPCFWDNVCYVSQILTCFYLFLSPNVVLCQFLLPSNICNFSSIFNLLLYPLEILIFI
jgi:hypothetical protein